jgi:hypothetical protein
MKKIMASFIPTLLLAWLPSGAIDLGNSEIDLQVQALKYGEGDYTNAHIITNQQTDEFDMGFEDEGIYEYDYKSPKKAFLYSLIVPGMGQRYAGSHVLKPLVFLGAEAGLWMGYFKYRNDGNKKTDEYHDYADAHWFEGDSAIDTTYRGWLYDQDLSEDDLSHTLPDVKNQEYYEMIGKYEQFRAGWDDYGHWDWPPDSLPPTSPHRETYLNMRRDANDFFDTANRLVIFSMINHLVSAFDAALAARRHNRSEASDAWLTVKTEMRRYSATESIPVIKFAYRF